MDFEVMREYLIKIGYVIDEKSAKDAEKKVDDFTDNFKRIVDTFKKVGEAMKKAGGEGEAAAEGVATGIEGVIATVGELVAGAAAGIAEVLSGIGLVITALAALAAAIGFAVYKFIDGFAKADQAAEILGKRLWTTEANARSLQHTMDAMGIKSMEQLRDINLNPELRKQFLELREATRGLEPDAGAQRGFERFRAMGYEMQKMKVLTDYLLLNVAGKLAQALSGVFDTVTGALKGINWLLKGTIQGLDGIVNRLGAVFTIGQAIMSGDIGFFIGDNKGQMDRTFGQMNAAHGPLAVIGETLQKIYTFLQDVWNQLTTPFRMLGQWLHKLFGGGSHGPGSNPYGDGGENPIKSAFKGIAGAFNTALGNPYSQLVAFRDKFGLHMTAGWEGGHNKGSLHGVGRAMDFASLTPDQIAYARAQGFSVHDERTRPRGQEVWTGPHWHVSVPYGSERVRKSVDGMVVRTPSVKPKGGANVNVPGDEPAPKTGSIGDIHMTIHVDGSKDPHATAMALQQMASSSLVRAIQSRIA